MRSRTTFATLLIILYGIALVKPAFPLMEYALKMDDFLARCANKESPELQCNGQCVLMLKLKSLNGEAAAPVPPDPVKVNLQEYPVGFVTILQLPFPEVLAGEVWHHTLHVLAKADFHAEIFHPPAFSV